MPTITASFIQSTIRSGHFTEAQARARDGTAQPKNRAPWEKFSAWALICEEVLDTEHDSGWYDDLLAELTRRGFDDDTINRMRAFAWQTAGWLNYDRMLWEWVSLDENDIRLALDFQLKEKMITPAQHAELVCYIAQPSRIPPVT